MTPDNDSAAHAAPATRPTRRQILRWGLAGLGGTSAAAIAGHRLSDPVSQASTRDRPAKVADRVLIVVEMAGGNDGLSTLVPFEDGRYAKLRPTLALNGHEVDDLGNGWGMHRALGGLARYGLAAVAGIGAAAPDLSHFEMQARWWAGTPNGGGSATGFLGRVCDRLVGDDAQQAVLSGVSVTLGPSPAISAESAPTASVSGPDGFGLVHQGDEPSNDAMRRCIERLSAAGPGDEVLNGPRRGLGGVLRISGMLDDLPARDKTFADSPFANQLAFAHQLIRAEAGVRVIHIPMDGGNFDTHENHRDSHNENMKLLGDGLEAFWGALTSSGQADRVLVATTSEFGRRPEEHNGGLDHGTASCALVMGAVESGMVGEPSSLRRLDDDANLIATVEFDRYLASLATWLDVDPASVLADEPSPIANLVRA